MEFYCIYYWVSGCVTLTSGGVKASVRLYHSHLYEACKCVHDNQYAPQIWRHYSHPRTAIWSSLVLASLTLRDQTLCSCTVRRIAPLPTRLPFITISLFACPYALQISRFLQYSNSPALRKSKNLHMYNIARQKHFVFLLSTHDTMIRRKIFYSEHSIHKFPSKTGLCLTLWRLTTTIVVVPHR